MLVGYGPRESTGKRRARKTDSPAVQAAAEASAEAAHDALQVAATPEPEPCSRRRSRTLAPRCRRCPMRESGAHVTVLAKPPVRKLAKDLGVDLTSVQATGAGGVITRADVEAAAAGGATAAARRGDRPVAGSSTTRATGRPGSRSRAFAR